MAAAIDRVGYSVVDVTGSSQFEVQVRHHHDNPWEGLDLLRAAMPIAGRPGGARQGARRERGRQFQRWTAPQPSPAEVRHAHGDPLSDEELILRFLMPDPDVDAMYAAGPVPQNLAAAETPGAEMVVELMRSSKAAYVALDHGDVHLTLSRERGPG